MNKRYITVLIICCLCLCASCGRSEERLVSSDLLQTATPIITETPPTETPTEELPATAPVGEPTPTDAVLPETEDEPGGLTDISEVPEPEPTEPPNPDPVTSAPIREDEEIVWNEEWEFAEYSEIHTDSVILFRSHAKTPKSKVVAVNAGHGTKGGNKVKTLCHPDGSKKVTGGSTAAGETHAACVSSGTTFLDGTPEYEANLSLAFLLKDMLLENGYDVLMIRQNNDTRLDNIARTVFSNNNADCHIALHYDGTDYDKGFFYIGVPDIDSYRNMYPVSDHWQEHNAFGEALLSGIRSVGVKVYDDGNVPTDLTQTSYSTIPSMDVEVGDRQSDYSEETQRLIAEGLLAGINEYFMNR